MKPDQHKQKKNAAYKKKHGISCEKQPTDKGFTSGCVQRGDQNSSKKCEVERNSRGHQSILKEHNSSQLNSKSATINQPSNEVVCNSKCVVICQMVCPVNAEESYSIH
jgi:hypothetical protein